MDRLLPLLQQSISQGFSLEQASPEERHGVLHLLGKKVNVLVEEIAASHGFTTSTCQIGWTADERTVSVWAQWQEEDPAG
jgi:hypothetical protein